MSGAVTLPGFADPVAGAQACFRGVLDALSRPGRLCEAGADLLTPPPLDRATAAVLLTLADAETPLWLDSPIRGAAGWIAFHCGARIAENIADAAFGVALALPDLTAPRAGTHEAPEDGATLVVQVAALGEGTRFRLSGPGLRAPAVLAVAGLPADFAARWARNHALFPRGIDLILCAGSRLAALPRSVAVEDA